MSTDPIATLIVTQGPEPGKVYELRQPSHTIGRELVNDIVINAAILSRKHAVLRRDGATYMLEDLGSKNGTFVNNQRLSAPRPLQPGDTVRFGKSIELIYQTGTVAGLTAQHTILAGYLAQTVVRPALATIAAGDLAAAASHQQLVIEHTDGTRQVIPVQGERLTLGRASDNDVRLDVNFASRYQALVERADGGHRLVPLPEATNPLRFKGRPVTTPQRLTHGDVLRLHGREPGDMLSLTYFDWSAPEEALAPVSISLTDRPTLTIGRDPSNDIRLDNPLVSHYHAEIGRVGARYRLHDLKSTNGTFVNGTRIDGEVWLEPADTIRIGSTRFSIAHEQLHQVDEAGGLRVEALRLNKWVRKGLNLLQDISLLIQPREFVVLVGTSGAGKSTLMDALAGYRPATHGDVLVNGISLYRNFDAVRNEIGYVPQRDIIHMELTVFQALDYSARLRMPADVSAEERHRRVEEVMADLDLTERRDLTVSALSGGQQKRVSIGVELLTRPGLFFLDEPTSGLDPGTETALMQLMRSLADQGRSIILITHATKNVMLADKVIFLVRGGQLAWYGPPNEALAWFDQYRSERERRAEDMSFDKIYNILEDLSKGTPADWEARFKASPTYEKYIAAPLGLTPHTPAAEAVSPALKPAAPRLDRAAARRVSGLRQFFILSARNLNILIRDRFSLILMLLTAPLLAAFDFIIARRDIFDSTTGRAERVAVTLFTLTITAIFVGALAQMREIVKEADIYKRERLVNLKIAPYVLSKIWLAMLLALYQSAAYLIVRYIAVKMPGGPSEMVAIYVTLVLASLAGMMLGLFVSALSPSANAAPLLTILVLIPQIILGGGILPISSLNPVGRAASSLMASRWGFEALATISGFGRDVAADTCWRLPKDERTALSSDYKDANCTCLGKKLFKQCYFPGLLAFYDSAVERSEPAKPVEPLSPGDPPPQPTFPPEPTLPPTPQPPPTPERPEPLTFGLSKPPAPPEQPEVYTPIAQLQYNIAVGQYLQDLDAFNRKAQAGQLAYMKSYTRSIEDYLDALQAYNDEVQSLQREYNDQVQQIREGYNRQVEAIRQQYADELNAYQVKVETARAEQERYRSAIEAYQQDYGEWQRARARSVAGAETMLANFYDRYGDVYAVNVPSRWLAQGGIIVGLFALILILQKRKDVV